MKYDFIGFIAGFAVIISFIPQIVKLIQRKSAKDISLGFPIIIIVGGLLWIVYSAINHIIPLLFWNSVAVMIQTILLCLVIKYK